MGSSLNTLLEHQEIATQCDVTENYISYMSEINIEIVQDSQLVDFMRVCRASRKNQGDASECCFSAKVEASNTAQMGNSHACGSLFAQNK